MTTSLLWKRLLIWSICLSGLAFAMPNAFYSRVESWNDARAAIEQADGAAATAQPSGWVGWLPSDLVNLGLDLRGGAHLLAEVQVEDVHAARMNALWPELRDALRGLHDQIGSFRRTEAAPGELEVQITDPAGLDAAIEAARKLASPGLTLTGTRQSDIEVSGTGDRLRIRLTEAERRASAERTLQQSLEIIRRRVDEAGTREPTIQRQGDRRILIEVPGIGSAAELKSLIGTTAHLSFNPVVGAAARADAPHKAGEAVLPDASRKGAFLTVDEAPVLSGEDLVDSQPSFDQNGRPAVSFRFNAQGARKFGDYTAAHIGRPFAIVLDGQVISAPVIQSAIPGGSGIITGSFTVEEANRLSVLLRAGALPASMSFLEERTIGPELGQDSIDAGWRAATVGMAAVAVFMIACYGWFGVIANVALAINMVLLIAALSLLGATLTLPGIAGIVLTMGMAVDANVLIYERIREELRQGKAPRRSVELGFKHAFSAIFDSNITGLLLALIMFSVGSGAVRGFSVTMGVGILTSMFTAVLVTRTIIEIWIERWRPTRLRIAGWLKLAPEKTRIDFFRWQYVTFGGSVAASVGALVLVAVLGLNFGIDFRGGTTIRTETTQAIDVGVYRAALSKLDVGDVTISEVFDPTFGPEKHVALVRIQGQDTAGRDAAGPVAQAEAALRAVDPHVTFPSVESVGPKVSSELIWLAFLAVGAGSFGILVYVWLRFEWQFALGTVASLIHDVVLTMGIFAALGLKFDLTIVAALLTILGYSVNDSVVVFDRLRENLAKHRTMPLRDLMNLSANETLSRTLMTAATTLIALTVLLIFGGDVIRDFVFAMIFGVLIGTYSTLYVAKNIVLFLGVDRSPKAARGSGHAFERIDA